MDNLILDEMQIMQLRHFIRLKGIREDDVIDEIVDHLACKTEELMNEHIYLPFEEAVLAAYYTFGSGGFKLIAKQYGKKIKQTIWKEFRKALQAVILSKRTLLAFGWCCFLSFVAIARERYFVENFITDLIFYLLLATMLLFYIVRFKYAFLAKNSLADLSTKEDALMWQKKIIRMMKIDILFLPFLFSNFYFKFNPMTFIVMLMMFGFLSMLNSFAKMETIKRMEFMFKTQALHG